MGPATAVRVMQYAQMEEQTGKLGAPRIGIPVTIAGEGIVNVIPLEGGIRNSPTFKDFVDPRYNEQLLAEAKALVGRAGHKYEQVHLALREQGNLVAMVPAALHQEVWAAGVTFLSSMRQRNLESGTVGVYDHVYIDANRPELFEKASAARKGSATGGVVGIRADSLWDVPEPELALLIGPDGIARGYTLGNDMSSRSIEGENPLYLPQAKVYRHSLALGPFAVFGLREEQVREWDVGLKIIRAGQVEYDEQGSLANMKRTFSALSNTLFMSGDFHDSDGAVLLTGTQLVPETGKVTPGKSTLQPGDQILITATGIELEGQRVPLQNRVIRVGNADQVWLKKLD